MNPDDKTHLMLAAYLDGELSPAEAIDMELRLDGDPVLRRLRDDLAGLSRAVRPLLAEPPVPEGLSARIAQRLDEVAVVPTRREPKPWRAMAAMLLIGLLAGGALGYGLSLAGQASRSQDRVLDALYAGHLRALAAPQPFDIASSDRHVVKPWFNGRTSIAPDAPDLGPDGFALAGGRIDIVDGEKVPTLVYRRREHVISVTVVPRKEAPDVAALARREGSNVERWDAGDLTYFAVSDLNRAELRQFATIFASRTAPRP